MEMEIKQVMEDYRASYFKSDLGTYEPMISISTRQIIPPPGGPRGAEIRVADNGQGIPKRVIRQIYQPFLLPNQQVREQD